MRESTRNAFERLELPEGHREMVKSLVTQHFRDKQTSFANDEQTDLIRGKGELSGFQANFQIIDIIQARF